MNNLFSGRATQNTFMNQKPKRQMKLSSLINRNLKAQSVQQIMSKQKKELNENEKLIVSISKTKNDYKNFKHLMSKKSDSEYYGNMSSHFNKESQISPGNRVKLPVKATPNGVKNVEKLK